MMRPYRLLPVLAFSFTLNCGFSPDDREDSWVSVDEPAYQVKAKGVEKWFSSVYDISKDASEDKFLSSVRLLLDIDTKDTILKYSDGDIKAMDSSLFPLRDIYRRGCLGSIEFADKKITLRYRSLNEKPIKAIVDSVPDSYDSMRTVISRDITFSVKKGPQGAIRLTKESGRFCTRPKKGLKDADLKAAILLATGKNIEPSIDIQDMFLYPNYTVIVAGNGKYTVIGPDGFTDKIPGGFKSDWESK